MGRIGFCTPEEVKEAAAFIKESRVLEWEGLFTHFSTADQADDTYWNLQKERFIEVLKKLPELPRYVHVSNSATALWHDETIGNMIRYGVAMYGLNPSGHALPEVYPLQPALELVSELIQVKNSQQVKESAMEKHISLLKQSGSERYRSVMQMAGHERCRVFLYW